MLIENKVKNLKTTDVKTFLSWTFNTLKTSKRDTTKLKNAIIKGGWSFPIITWAGHDFVIDGAGRKLVVEELIMDGYEIQEIPYVEIEAKDLEEAKLKALEVSSQFGEITRESFLGYIGDLKVDFNTFELKGIDESLMISPNDLSEDFKLPEGDKPPFQNMTFTLADPQADFIKSCLEQVKDCGEEVDNFGNENSNGNALFYIIQKWAEQKK
ncbi:MAG: hypothetical protein WC499_02525 [Patescibacteria group bacterium]